ncbi:MAG: hypothetical protein JO255_07775 [Alphaproteobacteria bacterium]|nr:hypothetical protein [Alphaproteobacteria bacterium]
MNLLFGHLNPNVFALFSGKNRYLYAHLVLAVYREYFGTTFLRTPLRPEIITFIGAELHRRPDLWTEEEDELLELPDPPQRRGRRHVQRRTGTQPRSDILGAKANHAYTRLLRCGWIEEEAYGFATRVDMPPAAMALAEQLLIIDTGLSQLFGGVIVEVRGALQLINQNALANALGLSKAAETSVGFIRRLRAIHSSLRSIQRDIMDSDNLDERIRTYFEDFIQKLLIQDFRTVLTTNHPYRFRTEILAIADRLSFDDGVKAQIAAAYVENNVEPDEEAAHRAVHLHLTTISDVFSNVEEYFEQINVFRARLEARLRNTVRYMERSDASMVNSLVDAIERLDSNADRAALLGVELADVPSFLIEELRPVAEAALAEPPAVREPIEPTPLQRDERDPALQVKKRLVRAFTQRFNVTPAQVIRYLEKQVPPDVPVEARWLRIGNLDDLLAFSEARRYRFGAPVEFDRAFEIVPAEGEHDCEWIRCENFIVRRREVAGAALSEASR